MLGYLFGFNARIGRLKYFLSSILLAILARSRLSASIVTWVEAFGVAFKRPRRDTSRAA